MKAVMTAAVAFSLSGCAFLLASDLDKARGELVSSKSAYQTCLQQKQDPAQCIAEQRTYEADLAHYQVIKPSTSVTQRK